MQKASESFSDIEKTEVSACVWYSNSLESGYNSKRYSLKSSKRAIKLCSLESNTI
jgi:hypothetical protein